MKTSFRKETANVLLAISVTSGIFFSNAAFSQPPNNKDIPIGKIITIPAPQPMLNAMRNGLHRIVPAVNLPGPDSYELNEHINQSIVAVLNDDAEYIEDSEISKNNFEHVDSKSVPEKVVARMLTFSISDISGATQRYRKLGVVPGAEISAANGKKWANLNRYYSLENGDQMMISEFDYNSANTNISTVSEFLNVSVNGTPASFRYFESDKNRRVAVLSWVTDRIAYTVFLTGETADKQADKLELLNIAHALK